MSSLTRWWRRVQETRAGRAWSRFGKARGHLLAGGVAYFAFFSVFPAVALAFTVFGVLLRGHPEWLAQISDYLDQTLPGFVQHGDSGLIPLSIPSGGALGSLGAVGALALLWSGLGWLGALRDGIRAVFGVAGTPGNVAKTKLRDLGVLVLLGLGIVVSVAASAVAGAAAGWLAEHIGLGAHSWPLTVVGVLVSAVLDGLLVLVVLRVLSGVAVPRAGLRAGAVVGGVGLTVLKVAGTSLVGGALGNPLFASMALVVGLLAWLNLMSRVVLFAAAWAAEYLPSTAPNPADEDSADEGSAGPGSAAGAPADQRDGQHTQG